MTAKSTSSEEFIKDLLTRILPHLQLLPADSTGERRALIEEIVGVLAK
jgi:hypothetical protein